MKLLTSLFLLSITVFFSHAIEANTADSQVVDKTSLWVVSPGTRLVAGNLKQNEFFILDKVDASNVPQRALVLADNQKQNKTLQRKEIAKLKLAINKTLYKAHAYKESKIKIAMTIKKNKIAHKKKPTHIKLAYRKRHQHKVKHIMLTRNN